jgi:hypothetical protein
VVARPAAVPTYGKHVDTQQGELVLIRPVVGQSGAGGSAVSS